MSDAKVAAAGPATHVPLVLLCLALVAACNDGEVGSDHIPTPKDGFAAAMFWEWMWLNVGLMLFNLYVWRAETQRLSTAPHRTAPPGLVHLRSFLPQGCASHIVAAASTKTAAAAACAGGRAGGREEGCGLWGVLQPTSNPGAPTTDTTVSED